MTHFSPASVSSVDFTSSLYHNLDDLFRSTTIPAIIAILKDSGRFYALTWTPQSATTTVHPFWDSDCFKSFEACCYFLMKKEDSSIRHALDEYVEIIKKAQWDDGYLNSHYTVHEPQNRFTNLRDSHELYSIGHLSEFAVAYFLLTGSHDLINVCKRFIELLHKTLVPRGGYDGHQELELALMRLYEVTQDKLFLDTAGYLIKQRGQKDEQGHNFFDQECIARGVNPAADFREKANFRFPRDYAYMQADQTLVEQKEIDGHCVRAIYWLTGAQHYGSTTASKEILAATHRLFDDIVDSKMYITGGLGAVARNEGFGPQYYLPDSREAGACYSETCASFGMAVLCERLLRDRLWAKYGDVMETNLLNCVLGAVGTEGTTFYYKNPLTTTSNLPWPRKKWFKVACCPPNIVKTWGMLGSLQFATRNKTVAVHLYFSAEFTATISGSAVSLKIESNYPYSGAVKVTTSCPEPFELALRIPGWSHGVYKTTHEGREADGYLSVHIPAGETEVNLDFEMRARLMHAHPRTRKDQIAVVRGPMVYCAESVDNDFELEAAYVSDSSAVEEASQIQSPGFEGVPILRLPCTVKKGFEDLTLDLYGTEAPKWEHDRELILIPYYLRANRGGSGGMRVWMNKLLAR